MQVENYNRAIVIICSNNDYYLAKICVASIRYFYPNEEIYLVKDKLNGPFSSKELEDAFNVQLLDIGVEKLGWGAGKLHFLLSNVLPNKRVLLLDADIVFLGQLLDSLYDKTKLIDFVVDTDFTDYNNNPNDPYVKKIYFDYPEIKKQEPDYEYPGFFFNTGQLIVKTGKLTNKDLELYFNSSVFPYYTNMKLTPLVDQSILNIILVKKAKNKEISLAAESFMLWSDGNPLKEVELDLVKQGKRYPYLIHYAGSFKSEDVRKMIRPDILEFFLDYYYSRVPNGSLKKHKQILLGAFIYNKNKYLLNIKGIISKTPLNKSLRYIHKVLIK